jgi:hypothetical protein
VPLGADRIGLLRRELREDSQRPDPDLGRRARRSAQHVPEHAIGVARPPAPSVSPGGAGRFDQALDRAGQLCATPLRLSQLALHPEDGCLAEPGLGVTRRLRQHALEVGERTGEVVPALLEGRSQEQDGDRRRRQVPPRRERRLGIPVIARIGLAAADSDVASGKRERDGKIIRVPRHGRALVAQIAGQVVAGRRQPLQHLGFALGNEWVGPTFVWDDQGGKHHQPDVAEPVTRHLHSASSSVP